MRVLSKKLAEAEDLISEVNSWSNEEVEELPKFYREKAKEYRDATESG
jgi:hypothetical protein